MMRIIELTMNVNVVWDDGEDLHPVNVNPMTVPGSEVDGFIHGGLAETIDNLKAKVEERFKEVEYE